jgi:PAS domain S-box-containing protein
MTHAVRELAQRTALLRENAELCSDLQRTEVFLAQAQRVSHTGTFGWSVESERCYWSEELYNILEYDRCVQATGRLAIERVHPGDRDRVRALIDSAIGEGKVFDSQHRLLMPDGRVKHVHATGQAVTAGDLDFVGAVRDVTERVHADEALRQARADLAHVVRVATLNAMTASIAHEVSQPLSGILTNADTCLRMLAADPPKLAGAIETARRTVRDAHRASEVIRGLRAMFSTKAPTMEMVDLNDSAREVIALSAGELQKGGALLRTAFAEGLPPISADRVQLQQVILNLLLNAADAMAEVEDRPRILLVETDLDGEGAVRLAVRDSGTGVDPHAVEKLFEPFYTTKPGGMGVGLSICRSIIENHDGHLWAEATEAPGATFSFRIPAASRDRAAPVSPKGSRTSAPSFRTGPGLSSRGGMVGHG